MIGLEECKSATAECDLFHWFCCRFHISNKIAVKILKISNNPLLTNKNLWFNSFLKKYGSINIVFSYRTNFILWKILIPEMKQFKRKKVLHWMLTTIVLISMNAKMGQLVWAKAWFVTILTGLIRVHVIVVSFFHSVLQKLLNDAYIFCMFCIIHSFILNFRRDTGMV